MSFFAAQRQRVEASLKPYAKYMPGLGVAVAVGYLAFQYCSYRDCKRQLEKQTQEVEQLLITKIELERAALEATAQQIAEQRQVSDLIKENTALTISLSHAQNALKSALHHASHRQDETSNTIAELQLQHRKQLLSRMFNLLLAEGRRRRAAIVRKASRKCYQHAALHIYALRNEICKLDQRHAALIMANRKFRESKPAPATTDERISISTVISKPFVPPSADKIEAMSTDKADLPFFRYIELYKRDVRERREKGEKVVSERYLNAEAAFWQAKKRVPLEWTRLEVSPKLAEWFVTWTSAVNRKSPSTKVAGSKTKPIKHEGSCDSHVAGECPTGQLADLLDVDGPLAIAAVAPSKPVSRPVVPSSVWAPTPVAPMSLAEIQEIEEQNKKLASVCTVSKVGPEDKSKADKANKLTKLSDEFGSAAAAKGW